MLDWRPVFTVTSLLLFLYVKMLMMMIDRMQHAGCLPTEELGMTSREV